MIIIAWKIIAPLSHTHEVLLAQIWQFEPVKESSKNICRHCHCYSIQSSRHNLVICASLQQEAIDYAHLLLSIQVSRFLPLDK